MHKRIFTAPTSCSHDGEVIEPPDRDGFSQAVRQENVERLVKAGLL